MNIDYKNNRVLVTTGFTNKYKFPIGDGRTMPSLNIQHQKHNILLEEIEEHFDAICNQDKVETLDALCDIEFVIHGAMDAFGFDLDIDRIENGNTINFGAWGIAETYSILYRAFCFKEEISEIENLFYAILNWHYYSVDTYYDNNADGWFKYKAAFLEVCRSNGTKSCKTEDVMHATMAQPKYKNVEFINVIRDGEYNLYRKDDGKLIKSIDYSPANLLPFIA
jgi:hypothetical protein